MRYLTSIIVVSLLVLGCAPSQDRPRHKVVVPPRSAVAESSDDDRVFDYQHEVRKSKVKKRTFDKDRVLKRRIAVSRFGDLLVPAGSPFFTFGANVSSTQKKKTSVKADAGKVDFQQTEATQRGLGFETEPCPAFTGLLVNELIKSGRFIVLERKEINKLLREQDFGRGGRVLPQTAAQLRRVRGVEFIITGEVATLSKKTDKAKKSQTVALLRIYDVETAEIIASSEITAETAIDAVAVAAEDVASKVQDKSWQVKISAVRPNNVVILNAGREVGIFKSDRFEVMSLGREILDPDEGTLLAQEKSHLGIIEVFEVHEKYSKARMLVIRQNGVCRRGDLAVYIPGPYGDDLTDYRERLESDEFEDEL